MACDNYVTSDDLILCAGEKALYEESAAAIYADRSGAQGGTRNWVRTFTIACLRTNRIIYWRKAPGDCNGQVRNNANLGLALTTTGLKIGLSAVPIVGNALAAIVNFLPFAHHTQAVANEQNLLCDVATNYNAFADQIAAALANKQIPLQDAIVNANGVFQGLKQECASIAKPYNAAYGITAALVALQLMNTEAVYPSLVPGVLGTLTPSKVGLGVGVAAGTAFAAKALGLF